MFGKLTRWPQTTATPAATTKPSHESVLDLILSSRVLRQFHYLSESVHGSIKGHWREPAMGERYYIRLRSRLEHS